ncbi:hypothetical protein XCR1_2680020 [Xenorhabdus cabanillasii JM26]|uniref:Uncharacterized protein n=1 Tax=Xenorhabdus cabanillasii JM26 TaxID=1427517 RepID=W1J845_9GAMM|nr:hypothetical protein XCR1_2680020 [Xenorhabdus cabanillasii JM26]
MASYNNQTVQLKVNHKMGAEPVLFNFFKTLSDRIDVTLQYYIRSNQ